MAKCKLRDLIALPIVIVALLLVWLGLIVGSDWIKDTMVNAFVKTMSE